MQCLICTVTLPPSFKSQYFWSLRLYLRHRLTTSEHSCKQNKMRESQPQIVRFACKMWGIMCLKSYVFMCLLWMKWMSWIHAESQEQTWPVLVCVTRPVGETVTHSSLSHTLCWHTLYSWKTQICIHGSQKLHYQVTCASQRRHTWSDGGCHGNVPCKLRMWI